MKKDDLQDWATSESETRFSSPGLFGNCKTAYVLVDHNVQHTFIICIARIIYYNVTAKRILYLMQSFQAQPQPNCHTKIKLFTLSHVITL